MNRRTIIAASFRQKLPSGEHCSPTRRAKCLSKYLFPTHWGPVSFDIQRLEHLFPSNVRQSYIFLLESNCRVSGHVPCEFERELVKFSIKFKAATDPCGITCEAASRVDFNPCDVVFDLPWPTVGGLISGS